VELITISAAEGRKILIAIDAAIPIVKSVVVV
jgi:hypothetical protein